MPRFEFDEGSGAAIHYDDPANPTFSDTITLTEDGVTFSWSVMTTDGRTSIKHVPAGRFGAVRDYLEAKNVSGSPPGDTFKLSAQDHAFVGSEDDPIQLSLKSVVGQAKIQFFGTSGTETHFLNSSGTVSTDGTFDEIVFTTTGEFRIDSLDTQMDVNCFLEGTHVSTPSGETRIEDLSPGDEICLASGGITRIIWIAKQSIAPRFRRPEEINPVCIMANALGDGVPARDLYVTQDHALFIDGLLINAGALINGQSIYQVPNMPMEGFTYYHVETAAHDIILAEDTQTETFVDYRGRDDYDNMATHPDPDRVIMELPLPRVASRRLVPQELINRLDARAQFMTLEQAS